SSPALLFPMARIIAGIDVVDGPWPHAVKLHHGLALGPDEVLHASLPVAVRPGRQSRDSLLVEFVAHAEVERPGDNGHALRLWVRVRRHAIAVRDLDPEDERPLLARVAFEDGKLRAFR